MFMVGSLLLIRVYGLVITSYISIVFFRSTPSSYFSPFSSFFRCLFLTSHPLLIDMNPYNQSSSYMGLLYSQNFPYESFPPFSSQQTDAGSQREDTPADRKERRKWTPADDEVLISGWLNTSKDAVVGNDQKLGTFWKRVGEYVAASPHVRGGGEAREHLHCKQRWHKINDVVNKFYAAYGEAERHISS